MARGLPDVAQPFDGKGAQGAMDPHPAVTVTGAAGARRARYGAALMLLALPNLAIAELVSLHDLLGHSSKALDILVAETEYVSAQEDVRREKALRGWRLDVATGFGQMRDIIDETRTREFEAVQTRVSLSYPLLGAYAKQAREVEMAHGKAEIARIKRDAALKVAQLKLEDVYAVFWGAQESLEVVETYLRTEPRVARGVDGSADETDRLEALAGYPKARAERTRLQRRRDEARARLEQLTDRALRELVATGVQLPTVPEIDAQRLQADHPELAALRSQHVALREQLDDAVWWGIDADFNITQTTTTDRDDAQAGNGLFANVNVSMPLTFYKAGVAERRRLLADIELLDLELQTKSDDLIAEAKDAQAQHVALVEEVNALTKRTQAAGRALRRQAGADAFALARRLRNYYGLAMEEIDARTRYWRSHVDLRSYLLVGSAEPAPEPTGPETTDVGTRLIEPIRAAFP